MANQINVIDRVLFLHSDGGHVAAADSGSVCAVVSASVLSTAGSTSAWRPSSTPFSCKDSRNFVT